jgi:hypothetical protein
MVSMFPYKARLIFDENHDLKHMGFLFSVWMNSDTVTLGYYHKDDQVNCLETRYVTLGCSWECWRWVGWIIALVTDTIPIALFAAFFSAGYYLGIGTILGFLMGFTLGSQVHTVVTRYAPSILGIWEEEMFLNGKMCTIKSLGMMTCVLEGPDGELFFTHLEVVIFNHYTKRSWFTSMARMPCRCCTSSMKPILREVRVRHFQDLHKITTKREMDP